MSSTVGVNQHSVLRRLAEERGAGVWYPGCGWTWTNTSTTTRIMEALVVRGLVERREYQTDKGFHLEYRITEAGREYAKKRLPVRRPR